jgi:hypothetical protein
MSRLARLLTLAGAFVVCAGSARAITNPDISVVGQPFFALTDDPVAADRNRLVPNLG